MRKRRLVAAAVVVGLAWIVDGIEPVSWLAAIGALFLAMEAADAVRARSAGQNSSASSRSVTENSVDPEPREPAATPPADTVDRSEMPGHHTSGANRTNSVLRVGTAITAEQRSPENPRSQPEPIAPILRTDGPARVSRVKATIDLAIVLISIAALVAMAILIATYDGPRGTAEVTCFAPVCTVKP